MGGGNGKRKHWSEVTDGIVQNEYGDAMGENNRSMKDQLKDQTQPERVRVGANFGKKAGSKVNSNIESDYQLFVNNVEKRVINKCKSF